ncbi:glycosyltransferase involved in cell wall biosynthesis [Methanocalculus sp. AMF5]|uniref:glycosyltransferase n=1 Tax=Methanocalculus sp. AMF5 TaxID=1198257 RepID=UPI00209E3CA0|nr:glycosyltransferase [Methanocalculus sp. AMF5]MCP1663268.1 glycosyltransferase involved in cell wall biosynthesis [Methanocalculus sp. AMF5]
MQQNTLITVYITNYNYSLYVKQAIDSVLQQTCQDFELLIIDDGSTDNSREIIEEYRNHQKIQIIYQKNRGLNYSNNIAIRIAQGKYIMRLDADDYLDPRALEEMSNELEKDSELGLIFPDYYYVDSEGTITGEERRHDFKNDVSLFDQPAHGACTMIRLKYLRDLGGYNDTFTCQDGYDLWIKFIYHHKVSNINKPLFYYRKHDTNLTRDEGRILETRREINQKFIDLYYGKKSTLAIIPVRKTHIGDTILPLYVTTNGKTILENLIEQASLSENIDSVVVTSEDDEILNHAINLKDYFPKLCIISRPEEYAQINEPLNRSIYHILDSFEEIGRIPEAIMILSIDYPFIKTDHIDDAINTMTIFKTDSLLSVRPDTRTFFQHNGHGMTPILNQDSYTRYEREALYKGAGGIVSSTVENFKINKKMASGKIGHVIVDQRTAFGIFSDFDMYLFKLMDGEMGE